MIHESNEIRFENVRDWFISLQTPSFADFVPYEKVKQVEEARQARIAREKLPNETAFESIEEAHTDEQLINIPNNPGPICPSPEPAEADEPESDRISSTEQDEAIVITTAKGTRKAELSESDFLRRRQVVLGKVIADKNPKSRKKSHGKMVFTNAEIEELCTSDYVRTVQENQSINPAPTSNNPDKNQAMLEIVSQMPVAERGAARSDGKKIVEASKKYYGRPRQTEEGWKIGGLNSLLLPYQVCIPYEVTSNSEIMMTDNIGSSKQGDGW